MFWPCGRPSSNCKGASPGMWQFWQRGCWSTARIVSNAAMRSALEPEPAEVGVDRAIPLADKTRAANRTPIPNIEPRVVFMVDLPLRGSCGFKPQRQPPQALSRGGEDGVCNRWSHRRHAWFTNAARLLAAAHDVRLYPRHLLQPQERIVVEVGLLNASLLETQLAVQSRGEAIDHAALHLGRHGGGIDADAAVHRANHAVYPNAVVFHRDFRHLSDEASERLVHRDPTEMPFGKRLAPARLLRGEIQYSQVPWGVLEQLSPVLERVFFGRAGKLIHKALHHKSIMGVAHRPPPQHWNPRLGRMELNQMIGRCLDVRRVGGPFDRGCVHPVLD